MSLVRLEDIWRTYVLPHVLVYGLTSLDMSISSLYRVLFMRMILILANDKGNAEGRFHCRM